MRNDRQFFRRHSDIRQEGGSKIGVRETRLNDDRGAGQTRVQNGCEFDPLELPILLGAAESRAKSGLQILHLGLLPFLPAITQDLNGGASF